MRESALEFSDLWYYKPDGFDELSGVWPVRIGHNIAKPNYGNGPRQTPYCNMHFIREGKVQLFYGEQQVVLGEGDIFCKFPNTVYTYQIVPSEQTLRMAWITFDGQQARQILTMVGFAEDKPYLRNIDKDIEIELQQIFQWCKGNSRKQLMTMYSLMFRIFSKLLPDKDIELQQTPNDWVSKSLDFIHAYYSDKITVEDVAKYVRLHRTYLSKIFKKQVGMPPSHYLIKMRLDRGKQLLLESPLSVTEIALSVGYPDIYSFTRAFTRCFGVSPNSIRKQSGVEPR
ncbi:AraC family transcriptional regulator [Paenibacillus agricola]|uniref:AraC family transcriptional regulator n=1 Tax=Paenibacillus agricola TaxID=2716264 RepID=A0ABX0JDD7_9BACL|nr:AraC family transcriptional regulator [Paenibacillus agricola]NHN34507.1 AraC family transcriptional regulator [Paenibacillus agricola]